MNRRGHRLSRLCLSVRPLCIFDTIRSVTTNQWTCNRKSLGLHQRHLKTIRKNMGVVLQGGACEQPFTRYSHMHPLFFRGAH
jgi:hypothetical protein